MLSAIFQKIQKKSRQKKFDLFMEKFKPTPQTTILDVGCGDGTFLEEMYPWPENITCLEISKENIKQFRDRYPDIVIIEGDACNMPFIDNSFDIVFSNAVIEHVGGLANQEKYASEVRRVSKKHFITTPNKLFPFEPHFRLPLFQFVPKSIQKWLSKRIALGNYPKGCWENINLLTPWQLQELFLDSYLIAQRVTFMAETLIAIKE